MLLYLYRFFHLLQVNLFIICYITLLLHILIDDVRSFYKIILGTVRFTQFPSPVVYANEGSTTTLKWEYYVSDKAAEFGLTSPKWEYYNETTRTWIEIANEARARSWNWAVSASCPPSLKPRLKKVSNATIQIIDVSLKDAGRYRCRLLLSTGSPISKETRLNVTKGEAFL